MAAGLETFAKVRALHDATTHPGEKASAAARMKTLARKAGMTVAEAVSKLDAPPVEVAASTTVDMGDAFNAFFNSPKMRAERAEREARRQVEAAAIIERYGSLDAVYADAPMEAALRAACEPLLGPGETWRTVYRLDGWGSLSPDRDMPDTLRAAVSEAWPLPTTVAEAWAEHEATETRARERYTVDMYCDPEVFSQARSAIVRALLDTLPARSLNDVRARLSWLEFWPGIEVEQNHPSLQATLATLRADIERMGQRLREQDAQPVQDGHPGRGSRSDTPLAAGLTPCRATAENSAEGGPHTGHPLRRTNADKRHDVLALLNADDPGIAGLTDREIARRAGVSPTTVGTIRRSRP